MFIRLFTFPLIFALASCGGDSSEQPILALSGTQAAAISGNWQTDCYYELSLPGYVIDRREFSEGVYTNQTRSFTDQSCSRLIEDKQLLGTYEILGTIELSDTLFARDIDLTIVLMIDGVGTITSSAYYFISGEVLYFGYDRGEGGDVPQLQLNATYRQVE